jgi:membrane dipeptidase
MRRVFVFVLMTASIVSAQVKVTPQAKAIHDSAIVIDTHADTTQFFLDPKFDLQKPPIDLHLDLEKSKRGNLGAEFFSIWVEPTLYPGQYAHRTLQLIDGVYEQARKHPDKMMMAFSVADIQTAHRQHKLAALMGIEGGHSIENDLGILRDYHRLGVRYMTLSWSNSNEFAESSGKVVTPGITPSTHGLTDFGKKVVLEMNRLGMMVDISHVSDQTFWDTIATTKAPIIASHSSARALTNAPRNMTDEMLKAMTKNGGVVMVNYFPGFIDEDYRKASNAQRDEMTKAEESLNAMVKDPNPAAYYYAYTKLTREYAAKIPRPPFKSLIDHLDHIAKVAGIDHVGLGSDFDGVPVLPQEIDSAADLPKITQALLDRGYKADDIKKILGGNLLRVFGEVERVSRRMNGAK